MTKLKEYRHQMIGNALGPWGHQHIHDEASWGQDRVAYSATMLAQASASS